MKRLPLAFTIVVALVIVLAPPAYAVNGWITSCGYSHSAIADPMVMPMHMHDFVGATTTDNNSTFQSLLNGGTMCHTEGDHAAYWVPESNQGVPFAMSGKDMLAYYLGGAPDVQPFPDGFRMILGNAHAMDVSENPDIGAGHIFWKCGPGSAPHLDRPPSSCGGSSFLVTVFQFPRWWDGTRHPGNEIDTMSYNRDAEHTIALPRLVLYFRNQQATGNFGQVMLSSGPWYTEHADYFGAWDPDRMSQLVDQCINGSRDCGVDPGQAALDALDSSHLGSLEQILRAFAALEHSG